MKQNQQSKANSNQAKQLKSSNNTTSKAQSQAQSNQLNQGQEQLQKSQGQNKFCNQCSGCSQQDDSNQDTQQNRQISDKQIGRKQKKSISKNRNANIHAKGQGQQNSDTNAQSDAPNSNALPQDPITGVLKFKRNKNKKTKEVSLKFNYNIQQLVELLQAHNNNFNQLPSNQGQQTQQKSNKSNNASISLPSSSKRKDGRGNEQIEQQIDINQLELNLIIQYLTKNIQQTWGANNANGDTSLQNNGENQNNQNGCNINGIDPQILEQFFCIDQQEEDYTDSEEEDEYGGSCEEGVDGDLKHHSYDDQCDDQYQEDSEDEDEEDEEDEDEDDDDDSDEDDDDDYDDEYEYDEDEDEEDDEDVDEEDEDDELFANGRGFDEYQSIRKEEQHQYGVKQEKDISLAATQQSQNQSSLQQQISSSSTGQDKLIAQNEGSGSKAQSSTTFVDRLKMKQKLQKGRRQLEAQRAQLQHQQKQQRLKQQRQMKKEMNRMNKQYHEDGGSDGKRQDNVEFGQEYFEQQYQKGNFQQNKVNKNQDGGQQQQQQQYQDTTVDGDNSSQYEDIDNEVQYMDEEEYLSNGQRCYSSGQQRADNDENISLLLKQKLLPTNKLSSQFHRFFENFSSNVDFIIQYEYNILPQQKCYQNFSNSIVNKDGTMINFAATSQGSISNSADQRSRDAAQMILKKNYNNLKNLCELQCKCFTGPHSVLQIFIEKIVKAIESFSSKLQALTKDELLLWVDNSQGDGDSSQAGIADGLREGFKQGIKDCMKQVKNNQSDKHADQNLKLLEENPKSDKREKQSSEQKSKDYLKSVKGQKIKFKPLMKNLPNYTMFLQNIICHYNLIIKQYAKAISSHFTEMTKVIKEVQLYEFPSQDIHRAIINKLIINDQNLFSQFFNHIKKEYNKHEKAIERKMNQAVQQDSGSDDPVNSAMSKSSQNLVKFMQVFQQYKTEVEADIKNGVTALNIDFYMRDLKKHALVEYDQVYQIELQMQKKSQEQYRGANNELKQMTDYNEQLNKRYGFMLSGQQARLAMFGINSNDPISLQNQIFDLNLLDAKEKKKLKKKQRKRDKKIKQLMAQNGLIAASDQSDGEYLCENGKMLQQEDVKYINEELNNMYHNENCILDDNTNGCGCAYHLNCPDNKEFIRKMNQFHPDSKKQDSDPDVPAHPKKSKTKKGKNGGGKGKLTQEEIRQLTTDEVVNYIESQDRQKRDGERRTKEGGGDEAEGRQEEGDGVGISGQAQESKSISLARAKAKAFIQMKQGISVSHQVYVDKSSQSGKAVDLNRFTCKFCNGCIDEKSQRFVHDKMCQFQKNQSKVNGAGSMQGAEEANSQSSSSKKGKKMKGCAVGAYDTSIGGMSTQGSCYLSQNNAEEEVDEDQQIQEFARKLEMIQKQPPVRSIGQSGIRRRRKLKPNVSKDWLNKLRTELSIQSAQNSGRQFGKIEDNPEYKGQFGSSNTDLKTTRGEGDLSDLTADQIQANSSTMASQKKKDASPPPNTTTKKFDPKKLNLSVSASANMKKLQSQKVIQGKIYFNKTKK